MVKNKKKVRTYIAIDGKEGECESVLAGRCLRERRRNTRLPKSKNCLLRGTNQWQFIARGAAVHFEPFWLGNRSEIEKLSSKKGAKTKSRVIMEIEERLYREKRGYEVGEYGRGGLEWRGCL